MESPKHTLRGMSKRSFFHGPGDGSDPEDLTACWSCGYRTHQLVEECPACGASMVSRRWARRYGAVLVVLGAFLALGMTWLLLWMLPTLSHPGEYVGGHRFSGTASQARGILALLGAVWVFGVVAFSYGLWQVFTGKRNRKVVGVLVAIAAALYIVGTLW